jgi:hydroxymethylglutaryl-CoA synthase
MVNAYDFYKPDFSSEFPTVDGKISIQCYLSALDACFKRHSEKEGRPDVSFNDFDFFCFHAPYCKLVQKSFARLCFNDYVFHVKNGNENADSKYPDLVPFKYKKSLHFLINYRKLFTIFRRWFFRHLELEETYFNRELEQAAVKCSKAAFETKTLPSLMLASAVGNMYTPSLYGGLVSLLVK